VALCRIAARDDLTDPDRPGLRTASVHQPPHPVTESPPPNRRSTPDQRHRKP
jgi:hypothetical protein